MINDKLINPGSIVVVGGSDDITKPGGKVLSNLRDGRFRGDLMVVNPRSDLVQGIRSYPDAASLPSADLAILAIPARFCEETVKTLAENKGTKAFIILSAGFGEENADGKELERRISDIVTRNGGSLIGPNCIGIINNNYSGVFTTPVPPCNNKGVDFISGSGATAVFIMESAIPNGLPFASVWSVGNSVHTGVEDVLEYLDDSYEDGVSPQVKLLYLENISNPAKLLKHSLSLRKKGCRLAAIKSGSSEAGSRAASSHTGALASSDMAVDALFARAGIIRCYSRSELTAVASVALHKVPEGNRMAVITHAGGPAVMLTDALSKNGFEVPGISGPKADLLKSRLFPGSSVGNPIDFLATGTAEQLGCIIDAVENDFQNIDSMAVIFGSPGLSGVTDVYELLSNRIKSCRKPIFAILPSVINVKSDIDKFTQMGNINFPDEVVFAEALGKLRKGMGMAGMPADTLPVDSEAVRKVIESVSDGYLGQDEVNKILDAAGVPRVPEIYTNSINEAVEFAAVSGFPVAVKVSGPLHKSDVGGVELNIANPEMLKAAIERMKRIEGYKGVVIQKMISGTEIFAGIKAEGDFGHLILAGLGGIFIEVLKDFSVSLAPVGAEQALKMISSLKGYRIIKGVRGRQGIDEKSFAALISQISSLAIAAPEIVEMDINPLIGNDEGIFAVDARIRIEKQRKHDYETR
jgi:acetyltransferase